MAGTSQRLELVSMKKVLLGSFDWKVSGTHAKCGHHICHQDMMWRCYVTVLSIVHKHLETQAWQLDAAVIF